MKCLCYFQYQQKYWVYYHLQLDICWTTQNHSVNLFWMKNKNYIFFISSRLSKLTFRDMYFICSELFILFKFITTSNFTTLPFMSAGFVSFSSLDVTNICFVSFLTEAEYSHWHEFIIDFCMFFFKYIYSPIVINCYLYGIYLIVNFKALLPSYCYGFYRFHM